MTSIPGKMFGPLGRTKPALVAVGNFLAEAAKRLSAGRSVHRDVFVLGDGADFARPFLLKTAVSTSGAAHHQFLMVRSVLLSAPLRKAADKAT